MLANRYGYNKSRIILNERYRAKVCAILQSRRRAKDG